MTVTAQPTIVPRIGGWSIAVAFRDASGNPVDLTAAGLVPHVDFYQPNIGRTTACDVSVTNAVSGQAVALVPQDVVQSTLQPSSNLLGGLFGASSSAPCRVEAYVVDGQGTASPPVVGYIQPMDWRTADPLALPSPPMMVVPVGPAGKQGDPGQPGAAGPSGSSDPQPVTFGGAVTQHQVVYLGATGALPASCDQPAQLGLVLGLALGAGALGQPGTFTATGVVTDPAWNWKRGPIFLGLAGALTQTPPSAGFVQQVASALTPTSIRVGLGRPVLIDVPDGFAGGTYLDLAAGAMRLRPAAEPGSADTAVFTGPDGFLPAALLGPVSIRGSRLAGGPHLASLPNGCFEEGLDGWSVSKLGTGEAYADPGSSVVGRQSAYLHCPAAGDVAAVASSPVPCGEGVPVYVGSRVLLRSGVALAVLSALFYDRNGALIGTPAQVGTPLSVGPAYAEFGGYVLPPAGTRYGAAAISNTGALGAVGAVNVDELMLHRQTGGPAAWQVRRAARSAIAPLGGTMGAFLAMLGDTEATDGTAEAGDGATPAPIGGLLYGVLSLYLQKLGLQDPDLTRQLAAVWGAATAILPGPTGAPAPPPVVVSAKTSQVISAVRPVLMQRSGRFSTFVADYIGDGDAPDRAWEALYVDPAAPIGGVLYARLLAYLTDAAPQGLAQPTDQSIADLAAAWAAAPAIVS